MVNADKFNYSFFMTSENVNDWGEKALAVNRYDEVKTKAELLAMDKTDREVFLRTAYYVEFGNPKAFQSKEEFETFDRERLNEVW